MVEVRCEQCSRLFQKQAYAIKGSKHNFCSYDCRNKWARSIKNPLRNRVEVHCEQCNRLFNRIPSQLKNHNLCSLECRNKWRRGSNSPSWKGGTEQLGGGYIGVKVFKGDFFHPMANQRGYVAEHRLVMAKHIQRCLLPWEIVHHKNGIKADNHIINLELLPSSTKHYTLTRLSQRIKQLEAKVEKLERDNKLLKWHVKELNQANLEMRSLVPREDKG